MWKLFIETPLEDDVFSLFIVVPLYFALFKDIIIIYVNWNRFINADLPERSKGVHSSCIVFVLVGSNPTVCIFFHIIFNYYCSVSELFGIQRCNFW